MAEIMTDMRGAVRSGLYAMRSTIKPSATVSTTTSGIDVLSGSAEYNDNGNVITISAGDVTYTGDGEGHGLVNNADEPFEMIALILFEKQKTE